MYILKNFFPTSDSEFHQCFFKNADLFITPTYHIYYKLLMIILTWRQGVVPQAFTFEMYYLSLFHFGGKIDFCAKKLLLLNNFNILI